MKLINEEKTFTEIMEWLYVNDGGYSDKLKWRKDFVAKLKEVLIDCPSLNLEE